MFGAGSRTGLALICEAPEGVGFELRWFLLLFFWLLGYTLQCSGVIIFDSALRNDSWWCSGYHMGSQVSNPDQLCERQMPYPLYYLFIAPALSLDVYALINLTKQQCSD